MGIQFNGTSNQNVKWSTATFATGLTPKSDARDIRDTFVNGAICGAGFKREGQRAAERPGEWVDVYR